MQAIHFIAEVLKREGISKLFCYPTTPIIEAAAAAGIQPVLCRQERVGIDMANGYTRVQSGRPFGVFAMQYGPGTENAFSGIATAYSDSTPLLLLPLGHRTEVMQVRPTFWAARNCAGVTKSLETMMSPGLLPAQLRRAMNHLKNGPLGPVMIEVPMDLMHEAVDPDALASMRPVRHFRSAADPADVERAAALLLQARCPIIQAGQGVLYARAWDKLQQLAELCQLPVLTTVEGKSCFPESHPLSLGTSGAVLTGHGRVFLERADLVLAIGSSLTRHHLTNRVLPPADKQVIHLTHNAADLYKGYETDAALLGDIDLVLDQLIEAVRDRLGGKKRSNAVQHEIREIKTAWLADWQHKLASNQTPITPYRVISEFSRAVPANEAIVTHDSGSPRDQMLPFYESGDPHSYLGWGKSHALGTGLGLTIGAKLARPERFCANFMGDAAFGMTGLDFETAVRVDAPICTIVLNNSTMAVETKNMRLSHQLYGTRNIGGNYAAIARDLGGGSERVTDPSEVGPAILRAREQTRNGRAALLEIITNEETEFSYRKNSFSAVRGDPAEPLQAEPR